MKQTNVRILVAGALALLSVASFGSTAGPVTAHDHTPVVRSHTPIVHSRSESVRH